MVEGQADNSNKLSVCVCVLYSNDLLQDHETCHCIRNFSDPQTQDFKIAWMNLACSSWSFNPKDSKMNAH